MGQSDRDLIAWQKAMALVTDVYLATRGFHGEKVHGLTNQLRRTAVLIPGKIAEGQARFSAGEFYHFLSIARGSLVEVETHVQITLNLGSLSDTAGPGLLKGTAQLGCILNGLLGSRKKPA
jgi:four helix bundle protein